MISSETTEVLRQSGSNKQIAMIVTVDAGPEMKHVATLPDRRERGLRLRSLYARKKKPVLLAIEDYQAEGLRVIDELNGTPNMILSAPARVWKRMFREQGKLVQDKNIQIEADQLDFSETDESRSAA